MATKLHHDVDVREHLRLFYQDVRSRSLEICAPLVAEDYVIQTMPDVSPPKWHLAHTSWFFETFILKQYRPDYHDFDPAYDHLFNSYYVTHGDPFPRPKRGLLSRPTVEDVMRYRDHVDGAMSKLIDTVDQSEWEDVTALVILGLNHEQQHQELMLTDIKHIFSENPLYPAYRKNEVVLKEVGSAAELSWLSINAGLVDIGYSESSNNPRSGYRFAYDNEGPMHQAYTEDFKIASRCVTNGEYLEFMSAGGYQQPEHWLSDAWALIKTEKWQAPLYWIKQDDDWMSFTLNGLQRIELDEPVCHVSFYEAEAYASWKGKRLPTEIEWETAAKTVDLTGNHYEADLLRPSVVRHVDGLAQMFGDVWEWTSSAYTPYPRYRPAEGSIGEYNGKFMSGQMVLRGGSFATPQDHIRSSYRNFFYPKDRWQFSGIRLADDI